MATGALFLLGQLLQGLWASSPGRNTSTHDCFTRAVLKRHFRPGYYFVALTLGMIQAQWDEASTVTGE